MAKIRSDEIVAAGLEVLDEVGLDDFTTRRLAQRLGVESATLYWHFRDKAALLAEMAAVVLVRYHTLEPPQSTEQWASWFADHARSFRAALRAHRDGARLHAGTIPNDDARERIAPKLAFLVRAGLPRRDAAMALLAVSQFTIGCVMEEQARRPAKRAAGRFAVEIAAAIADADVAFEFGLGLLVDGLRKRARVRLRRAA